MKKSFLQGYVTVRKFGGYALPVPIQNKLLRNYCEENNFQYVLPQCEMIQENNYTYLFETLKTMNAQSNLGMCSINMIPTESKKFKFTLDKIIEKEIICHFIFENRVIAPNELKDFHSEANLRNLLKVRKKETFKKIFDI